MLAVIASAFSVEAIKPSFKFAVSGGVSYGNIEVINNGYENAQAQIYVKKEFK